MGLPNDLIEAAKIDGAGHLRIFAQIMLPLTKPVMVSCIVLSFIALWNEYLSPLIFLTNKKVYTIAQAIRWYLMSDTQQYELTMAAASIAIVPLIILFVFCQKYFVEGIATSGMKDNKMRNRLRLATWIVCLLAIMVSFACVITAANNIVENSAKVIFISGTGDDANSGLSPKQAVRHLQKATELLNGAGGTIVFSGDVLENTGITIPAQKAR